MVQMEAMDIMRLILIPEADRGEAKFLKQYKKRDGCVIDYIYSSLLIGESYIFDPLIFRLRHVTYVFSPTSYRKI